VTARAADAVIIGGGITGVSIAFQLAGLGLRRVLVLEKKFIGAGGTGRGGTSGTAASTTILPATSARISSTIASWLA